MDELLSDITLLHEYFTKIDTHITPEKHALLRSIKLSEEIGELNEQILGHFGYGRKEKVERYSQEHMEDEMADVLFSALMLAKALNIDVPKAIRNKMGKIKQRFSLS